MNENGKRVNKVGRWLKTEEAYMAANFESMSIEEMAGQLQRNPITVKKYVEEKLHGNQKIVVESTKNEDYDIQKSPVWEELKQQFNADELKTFLFHWANIVSQFKYDVFATERMQIVDAVRIEILMSRALKRANQAEADIRAMDDEIRDLEEMEDAPQDIRARIIVLKEQRGAMRIALVTFGKDYKELLTNKQNILRELKGTREQRIKRIEDTKETIGTWIAAMMDNHELRKEWGIEMEKMRLAKNLEYKRPSEYYTYLDGEVEQPILNSDNIKDDNT